MSILVLLSLEVAVNIKLGHLKTGGTFAMCQSPMKIGTSPQKMSLVKTGDFVTELCLGDLIA